MRVHLIRGPGKASATADTDSKATQSGKRTARAEPEERAKRIKAMARHANEALTNRSCAKGWSFAENKDPPATKGRRQLRLASADPRCAAKT